MIPSPVRLSGLFQKLAGSSRRAWLWSSAGLLAAGGLSLSTLAQIPEPAPAAAPVTAPSTDPAGLTALRQRYQNLLAAAAKPSLARWLSALENLEKQRIAAGDFDGASRVREKILSLRGSQAAGSASTPTGASRGSIVLRPAQARLSPGVEFMDASRETLRFKKTGGNLEWELTNAPAGNYEVRLTFGVAGPSDENDQPDPLLNPPAAPAPGPPDAVPPSPPLVPRTDAGGGVVEFRRLTNLAAGPTLLRRSLRSTGGWATFRTLSLGTIELDSRLARLSLRAGDCQALGLMDFRSVELAPVTRATTPGSSAYPKELARLKEVYQKQFTDLTKPVNAKYLKALADFEAQIARTRDTDTLALVRQEKKRLERGGDDTVQPPMTFDLPVNDSLTATIRGEARLTSQKDYLIRLRPAGGCEIIWKLTRLGIPPGTYKVQLDCRLTPETGGSALLFSMASGSSEPNTGLNISIPGTPVPVPQTSINPGNITIAKGSDHLFLRVTALEKNEGSLCDLKALHLTPVTPPAPAPAP